MYWGKIVGGLLGLLSARWYFVLLGIVAGHQFDRGVGHMVRGAATRRPDAEFLAVFFATMGHIAKADGQVSEEEIRAARAAMHTLGLNAEQTREAISEFRRGRSPEYPFEMEVGRFVSGARPSEEVRTLFLRLQLDAAISSGPVSRPARARLWTVSRLLGFSRVEFAQLEAVLRAQHGFAKSKEGRAQRDALGAAYHELGVDSSASDSEVKKAYRRLMNRFHPDKLPRADASAADVEEAGRRTRAIRGAYETVRKRRGFR